MIIKHPRNCQDIAKNGASTSGKYDIFNSTNEPFSVYCDLQSEPCFVWALIQSFTLGNKGIFLDKGFSVDFPVNETTNKVDWTSYRLSLARMQSLADHSTHLRASCNFPTDGLQYTDYARAKLAGHDIFGNWESACKMYEYVNIRGHNCSDCTALTRQKHNKAWVIKSQPSKCDFNGTSGAVKSENNFGRYFPGTTNPNHRCTSSPTSTTQHWFGVKHDL